MKFKKAIMKNLRTLIDNFVVVICVLFIVLFVYAAASKLLDFEEFKIQLGHSPLISAYAGIISYAVVIGELGISVLLGMERYRRIGLYLAFVLMVLFTAYIYIILHFSPYIPCSCGGILEKLGWEAHLVFNVVFVLLAVAGLLMYRKRDNHTTPIWFVPAKLSGLLVLSVAFMVLLFLSSEELIHHRNNFVRKFPPVPKQPDAVAELQYDSYYFAGSDKETIFLGNVTAPAQVVSINTLLKAKTLHRIVVYDDTTQFKATRIKVSPPYFYVMDGLAPCIYKGNVTGWNANTKLPNVPHFSAAEIMDNNVMIFRRRDKAAAGNVLGLYSLKNRERDIYHPELLERQIDGVFDTDGTMQYDTKTKKFVYLYFYRNQYIVTDNRLNLIHRGRTIDTTTKAKLKLVYQKDKDLQQLAAPPHIVNRRSATYGNLLFVNSSLPGRYDSLKMWDQANVIDVYNIKDNSYLHSFYVYKINEQSLSSFIVHGNHLYALIGTKLVSYPLGKTIRKALEAQT